MGLFGRFLSIRMARAIVAGMLPGQFAETLSRFEYPRVSIPVAVLIRAMIFPMMVQIDFTPILGVRRQPRGPVVTTAVNWLIKPFTMFVIAGFFSTAVFALLIPVGKASEYLARAILLGSAPCTAIGATCRGVMPPTPWCRSHSTT